VFGLHLKAERDVSENGEVVKQSVVLKNKSGSSRSGGQIGDVFAVENDFAAFFGIREVESAEDAEKGCFSGTGGSEEGDKLVITDFEVDSVEGFESTEGSVEVSDDDGHGRKRLRG
jgi:hypothetical protein